jgi:hypothetical protein
MKIRIISRKEWKAKPPNTVPQTHIPRKITIHHQGGSDAHPKILQQQFFKGAETIRGIQSFHMKSRGWCFSLDTEILTNNGWKNYETITKEDLVYTVEDGFISTFEKLFFKQVNTVEFQTLNYHGCFSLNHKLYCKKPHNKEFSKIEVCELLKNKTPYQINTGLIDTKSKTAVHIPEFYGLLAFIVADAHISKEKHRIDFGFKKQRKVEYVKRLLEECNIEYNEYDYTRRHRIIINKKEYVDEIKKYIYKNDKKELSWDFLNLPHEHRMALIMGYINSDGTPNTGEKNSYQYACSSNKKNMDILQALCHLSGIRTKLTHPKRSEKSYEFLGGKFDKDGNEYKASYILSINHNKTEVYLDLRNNPPKEEIKDVWGVDCGGKLIMIRSNGCVQITSNSDIGYHSVIAPNGDIYQGREFNHIGAHVKNGNSGNIGIMLIGNFEVETPTEKQLNSLKKLLVYLQTIYPTLDVPKCVFGHKDFNVTDCPGKNLYPIVMDIKNKKIDIYDYTEEETK